MCSWCMTILAVLGELGERTHSTTLNPKPLNPKPQVKRTLHPMLAPFGLVSSAHWLQLRGRSHHEGSMDLGCREDGISMSSQP